MATWLECTLRSVGPWVLGCILALVCGSIAGRKACGQTISAEISPENLLQMSPAELEMLYRRGTVGSLPVGRVRGTALLAPGTWRARPLARGTRLVWQGKVFEPSQSTAINRFFGLRMIRAQVYQGPSWLDGAPSLVLDYSQTSRIYANNRDEIRQVAPGLFLGLMFDRRTAPPSLSMFFALQE
jgi:hypothetical protein